MISKWNIKPYSVSLKKEWDDFVLYSRNGTFLFRRDYMDYHADRFEDCSLMIYYEEKLKSLIPAHRNGDVFYSHQGLTYGGIIVDTTMKAGAMLELFEEVIRYLNSVSITKWIYSPVPYIYSKYPSEEDLYALYRLDARLATRKISTVIPLVADKLDFSESKRWSVRKAVRESLVLCQDDRFDLFWFILENNLREKYDSRPVHTLEEIQRLHKYFPDNIVLHRVCNADGNTVAGCVMYVTDTVAHAQYISSTEEGRRKRAVDFLFWHLINETYAHKKYFDLGTSVVQGGRIMNESLIHQKEDLGGRAVVYDTYELDIR